jgi:hypothetical protein
LLEVSHIQSNMIVSGYYADKGLCAAC